MFQASSDYDFSNFNYDNDDREAPLPYYQSHSNYQKVVPTHRAHHKRSRKTEINYRNLPVYKSDEVEVRKYAHEDKPRSVYDGSDGMGRSVRFLEKEAEVNHQLMLMHHQMMHHYGENSGIRYNRLKCAVLRWFCVIGSYRRTMWHLSWPIWIYSINCKHCIIHSCLSFI